jgi:hypothetical protein
LDLTKAGRLAEANVAFANAKEIDPEEFAKEENYRKTGNWYNLSSPVSSPGLTNEPPDASSLTPDKPGPQLAGNAITWTAVASDPENDPLVFKFFLNGPATGNQWAEQTQWVSDNIWAWTTSAKDVGNNQVSVWVRDGKHAGPEGSDGIATVDYIVM